MIERVYTIPLRREFLKAPRHKRAQKAMHALEQFIQKHMKSTLISIDPLVNEYVWQHGMKNPPHHVRVKAVKQDDGTVLVTLEEDVLKGKPVAKKKEKRQAQQKKEEKKGEAEKKSEGKEKKTKEEEGKTSTEEGGETVKPAEKAKTSEEKETGEKKETKTQKKTSKKKSGQTGEKKRSTKKQAEKEE